MYSAPAGVGPPGRGDGADRTSRRRRSRKFTRAPAKPGKRHQSIGGRSEDPQRCPGQFGTSSSPVTNHHPASSRKKAPTKSTAPVTRRPIAGRSLLHKDRNQITTPLCLPPAIAPRTRTRGPWLTITHTEWATAADQKAPSLPAITVSVTKVGSKTAERANRMPAPTRAIGPVPLAERGFGAWAVGLRVRTRPQHTSPTPSRASTNATVRSPGAKTLQSISAVRGPTVRESVVPSTTVPTSTTRPKRATWPSRAPAARAPATRSAPAGSSPANPSAKAVSTSVVTHLSYPYSPECVEGSFPELRA